MILWVSRGHLCLYILHKVEIWTGVTEAWRTDGQLLTKYKSGALVTQNSKPLFFQIQEGTSAERILLCGLWDIKKDCSCGRKTALAEFWCDLENQFKITTTTCSSSSGWNNVYTTNPNYRFKMKRRTFLFIRICPSSMLKKRNIKHIWRESVKYEKS